MQQSRRDFIRKTSSAGIGLSVLAGFNPLLANQVEKTSKKLNHLSAKQVAQDEGFWYLVQKAYKQSPHFINLESGYFSPQPIEVMESQFDNIKLINEQPSFYMRRKQWEDKLAIRKQLADFAGVPVEELIVTRNTTESLDTIILGMDLKEGDEAIMTDQDYGSMLETFEMRARRFGIVNKIISIPLHPKNDNEIVDAFEQAITKKTKVIHVTHLINLTGQILPVRAIADMAHSKGIEVIVDAAHSFAHLDYKIPDLDGDYYGASLHKWLCCPLGSGILHMKKEKIAKVWPLFGDTSQDIDSIEKFGHIGTHPVSTNLTIASAIKFHNSIGSKRKEERLRYLKNYWIDRVKDLPKVIINTPMEDERSCGLANFTIEGKKPNEIADYLYNKHKIFTVGINRKSIQGVRVTPHLYTTIKELDLLVSSIEELIAS
ncbi:MAG: aminotransferase class V-fold PLP-dependent enzyme [Bacteroidota bacterium]